MKNFKLAEVKQFFSATSVVSLFTTLFKTKTEEVKKFLQLFSVENTSATNQPFGGFGICTERCTVFVAAFIF